MKEFLAATIHACGDVVHLSREVTTRVLDHADRVLDALFVLVAP